MRKFRKSVDHSSSLDESATPPGLNSPHISRKSRGGSLTGSSMLLPPGDPDAAIGSPGMRRRRSRIPSEEDDHLINFLKGGRDESRDRTRSVGNLCESIFQT